MAANDHETQQYLEGLSCAELRRLLDNPVFRSSVLDAAVNSERVSLNLDQLLDEEFQAMSPAAQGLVDRLAKSIAAKHT
jgi:hypothetical protein